MNIKNFFTMSIIGLSTLSAGTACAWGGNTSGDLNNGFYLQSDIGYGSTYSGWNHGWFFNNFNINNFKDSAKGLAYGGTLGYQFNSYIAAEIGDENTNGPNYAYLVGKLMYPLTPSNSFNVFLKGGINIIVSNDSGGDSNIHPMFGAGLQLYVTPNWYLIGQYSYFASDNSWNTSNVETIGIGHKFSL